MSAYGDVSMQLVGRRGGSTPDNHHH